MKQAASRAQDAGPPPPGAGQPATRECAATCLIHPADDGSSASTLVRQAQSEIDNNLYDLANTTSARALAEARAQHAPLFEIWALCLRAKSSAALGLQAEGFADAEQALTLAQGLGDQALLARAFNAVSFVALISNDEDHGHAMLERSVTCARKAGSDYDLFWGLNNLSYIYGQRAGRLAEQEQDAAEGFHYTLDLLFETTAQARQAADSSGDPRALCYAKLNLSRAHVLAGNYEMARQLIMQYAYLARQQGNLRLMAYANFDEAKLLAAQGHLARAIACIDTPEHLKVLCNSDDMRLMSHEALAAFHKRQGTFQQAVHHLEMARTLERQIQASHSERQIGLLTARLEVEEAHAEFQRLQSEATSLELRNRLLEQERAVERHNALHDPLTGLGNRRAADAAITRQLDQSARTGTPFMVAYVDADHFKLINDTFGHTVGDKVLVRLGQLLQSGLRGRDEVYRFGGEEFVILLVEGQLTTGPEICERLRCKIKDHNWEALQPGLSVTASFGLAVWGNETDTSELMSRADAALYRAKKQGRNRVVLH